MCECAEMMCGFPDVQMCRWRKDGRRISIDMEHGRGNPRGCPCRWTQLVRLVRGTTGGKLFSEESEPLMFSTISNTSLTIFCRFPLVIVTMTVGKIGKAKKNPRPKPGILKILIGLPKITFAQCLRPVQQPCC